MCQASVGNWRAGHLTPWVFNIDFQLPTKPFHTVPGLLPQSPFYHIFCSLREPPNNVHSLLLHQHFYCMPLLTGTVLRTFCMSLPWLLFLYLQLLVAVLRLAMGQTGKQLWEGGSSCHSPELTLLLNLLLPQMSLSVFQVSVLTFVESGRKIW